MCIGLHIKYPLLLSNFNENLIFSKDVEIYSKTKFHKNTSSGSRFVPCEEQTDRRTDKRDVRLIIVLSSFLNAFNYKNICWGCMDMVPNFEEDVGLND
jgi:hypothetical protein